MAKWSLYLNEQDYDVYGKWTNSPTHIQPRLKQLQVISEQEARRSPEPLQ